MIDAAFQFVGDSGKNRTHRRFFLLRSHAVTVERSVRFNTFGSGSKSLTWFGTYIYLPQYSWFTASKALR
jgi:hypothetical protein